MPEFQFSSAGKGLLAQDDPDTDNKSFDYLKADFGLISSSWAQFRAEVEKLVKSQDENTRYKVLYLGRHGQGYHNLAIEEYGEKLWDDVLSKQYGNDKYTWGPDPDLTAKGIQQAKDNNTEWKAQIKKGIPQPEVFYASPFTRALDTMQYTFDDILLDVGNPKIKPALVVEDLRETNGLHTCDKRSTKSHIEHRFPKVTIEKGFTEKDELWEKDRRETNDEHKVRIARFLNHLFALDWDSDKPEVYVSVTSHSGTIQRFLTVINHRPFEISTGGMIPVIIKAVRV